MQLQTAVTCGAAVLSRAGTVPLQGGKGQGDVVQDDVVQGDVVQGDVEQSYVVQGMWCRMM